LARSPERTYCNRRLDPKRDHYNPNFFQQRPEAARCKRCETAYEKMQHLLCEES